MRLERLMRRDGRLDDRGETHGSIAAAGLERRPFGGGQRQGGLARRACAMHFWKQQPRRILVDAANVGMNVDGPRHDDLAGDVMHFVRQPALRRRDDAVVFDPKIAGLVPPIHRIDDMAAFQMYQHEASPPRYFSISPTTAATEGVWLGCEARRPTIEPVSRANSTPS